MADRKRFFALLLCIGFALVLSVSSAFLIHEADHDCCGEDCPVCRTIAVISVLMRAAGLASAALPLFSAAAVCLSARKVSDTGSGYIPGTPVSRKVRLND